MMCRWLELVFSPRNQVEQAVSNAIRFLNPYLAFVTYRFHVEKAREIGKSHMPPVPSYALQLNTRSFLQCFNLILYRY